MSVQQSALQCISTNISQHNNSNLASEIEITSLQDPTTLGFSNNLLSTQNTFQKQNIEPMDLSNDVLAGFLCFQQDGQTNLDAYQGRGSQRDMQSCRGKQFSDRKALSAFSNRDAKASGFMMEPSFQFGQPKEDQTPYIFNSFTGNTISTMPGNNFFGGSIRNQPSFIGYRFPSANANMNGNPLMSNYQACIFPGHGYPPEDSSQQYLVMPGGARPSQPQPQSYRINFQQFDQIYNQQQQCNPNEYKSQEQHLFEKTVLNQLEQPQRIQETMPIYANSTSSYEIDPRMYSQTQVKNIPSGYQSHNNNNQLFFSQMQGNNNLIQDNQDEHSNNIITHNEQNQFNQQNAVNVNQSDIDFISLMSTAPGSQMPMLDSTPRQNQPCSFLNPFQNNNNSSTNNQHVYVSSASALNDRQILLMSEMKTEQIEDQKSSNEEQNKILNDNNFTTKLENHQEEQQQEQQLPQIKELQTNLQQVETINQESTFNIRRRKRANLTQNLKGENNNINNINNILPESSQIDINQLKGITRSSLLQQMTLIQSKIQPQQHSNQLQQPILNNQTPSDMPFTSHFSSGFEQQSQAEMHFSENLPQIISQSTIPQAIMCFDHSTQQASERNIKSSKPQLEEQGMACNCSKTKCLKMYCVCFQQGVMCGTTCRCSECQNSRIFQQERDYAVKDILSRNPDAFKKKIQEIPKSLNKDQGNNNYNTMYELDSEGYMTQQNGLTMVHKKGCNCKKTLCKKKYCECFSAGAKCTPLCRCEGCQNGKNDSLDSLGKHINIEGSNIVDYENYNKGNFVSIKTKNNQFGNIKLEIFRPTLQNSNLQQKSDNIFKDSIKAENNSVVDQQVNSVEGQNENNSSSHILQLRDSHGDDEDDIGEEFRNRKKIKVNNEDKEQQQINEQNSNFLPFLLQSDQLQDGHENYISFQSKQLNGSQSIEQINHTQIGQNQEGHMQQLLDINNLNYNQQEKANYNAGILSSDRSLIRLGELDEKKEMNFMEFLAN